MGMCRFVNILVINLIMVLHLEQDRISLIEHYFYNHMDNLLFSILFRPVFL